MNLVRGSRPSRRRFARAAAGTAPASSIGRAAAPAGTFCPAQPAASGRARRPAVEIPTGVAARASQIQRARWGSTALRLWDLRRGDDDDNRVSPHGRGLRGLVFSALLELNYLKAPLGFLALILGPALLVGVAPSIAVTYGRLLLHA